MYINQLHLTSDLLRWEISNIDPFIHASCYHTEMPFVGSGFGETLELAKKKAFSELNERYIVCQLNNNYIENDPWGLKFDGSCSGFALGYSREKTILRSICEAIERWTLSKWIDEGLNLNQTEDLKKLDLYQNAIAKHFSHCTSYFKVIPVNLHDKIIQVYVTVVLAWTKQGVFAGYGSKLNLYDSLNHAAIEALRNFLIDKNQQKRDFFPYNRITFFANNRELAESIINTNTTKSETSKWPFPTLKVCHTEQFHDFWVTRTIFNDWQPWQLGTEKRFLY